MLEGGGTVQTGRTGFAPCAAWSGGDIAETGLGKVITLRRPGEPEDPLQ
jgi:hypothetical protein